MGFNGEMIKEWLEDLDAVLRWDPAARSRLEVALCYPGVHAIVAHRLSHVLWEGELKLIARLVSALTRMITGIEIHPGAKVGRGVFIDHGMGVVIGETAVIGDDCLLYQGVTLGGTGNVCGRRHPTLGSHVVVGAGAKVLGNIRIGNHCRIGAGSVVLKDVPDECTVVGIPGRVIKRRETDYNELDHSALPDAEGRVIGILMKRIDTLESEVRFLTKEIKRNGGSYTTDTWVEAQSLEDRVIIEYIGEEKDVEGETSAKID